MANRWDLARASLARRFFLATVLQGGVILLLGFSLGWIFRHPEPTERLELPTAFQFGTLFLAIGSWCLHNAQANVRLERQHRFRTSLLAALGAAVLFVSVQSYGMWALIKTISPQSHVIQYIHCIYHCIVVVSNAMFIRTYIRIKLWKATIFILHL